MGALFSPISMKKSVFAAFSVAMLLAACSPAQQPSADEAMEGEAMEGEHVVPDGTVMKDEDMAADEAMVEGEAEMEAGVRVMQEEEVE
jgi:hypothetical protein